MVLGKGGGFDVYFCQDGVCIFFQAFQPAIPVILIIQGLPTHIGLALKAPVPVVGTGEHFPAAAPLIKKFPVRAVLVGIAEPSRYGLLKLSEGIILPCTHDLAVSFVIRANL